jgi:hypothetical protein
LYRDSAWEEGYGGFVYREDRHSTNNRRHDDEDGAAEEGHEGDFSADADADGPEELVYYQLVYSPSPWLEVNSGEWRRRRTGRGIDMR